MYIHQGPVHEDIPRHVQIRQVKKSTLTNVQTIIIRREEKSIGQIIIIIKTIILINLTSTKWDNNPSCININLKATRRHEINHPHTERFLTVTKDRQDIHPHVHIDERPEGVINIHIRAIHSNKVEDR